MREDKGGVEREQQGGHGGERGEVLVLKTALDLREDMKVDEALLYEISLFIVFISSPGGGQRCRPLQFSGGGCWGSFKGIGVVIKVVQ